MSVLIRQSSGVVVPAAGVTRFTEDSGGIFEINGIGDIEITSAINHRVTLESKGTGVVRIPSLFPTLFTVTQNVNHNSTLVAITGFTANEGLVRVFAKMLGDGVTGSNCINAMVVTKRIGTNGHVETINFGDSTTGTANEDFTLTWVNGAGLLIGTDFDVSGTYGGTSTSCEIVIMNYISPP